MNFVVEQSMSRIVDHIWIALVYFLKVSVQFLASNGWIGGTIIGLGFRVFLIDVGPISDFFLVIYGILVQVKCDLFLLLGFIDLFVLLLFYYWLQFWVLWWLWVWIFYLFLLFSSVRLILAIERVLEFFVNTDNSMIILCLTIKLTPFISWGFWANFGVIRSRHTSST